MINLEKFDSNNISHLELINQLKNDENVNKNVGIILCPNSNTYVIKNSDISTGLIKINKEYGDNYSIDVAVLEQYRGNNIGTIALKQITEMIEDYNKLLIRTKYDNKAAIMLAKKAGFASDYEENEKCSDEGVDYTIFSKR